MELLVVISIIGIITALSTVFLSSVRLGARDTQRLSDIKTIQMALENYYKNERMYPASLTPGQPLVGSTSSSTYMTIVPSNPSPRADGGCFGRDYVYKPSTNFRTYKLFFCLGEPSANFSQGYNVATENSLKTMSALSNGLIAWYRFDNNLNDSSSSGFNGSWSGSTSNHYTAGKIGYAGVFNGSDDFVDVGARSLDTNYTILFWLNYTNTGDAVILGGGGSVDQYLAYTDGSGSTNKLYHALGSGVYVGSDNHGGLSSGTWNHIAISRSGTTVIFYKNGELLGSAKTLGSNGAGSFRYFGKESAGTYYWFKGNLDDVRIYNRTLSSEEINDIYQITK